MNKKMKNIRLVTLNFLFFVAYFPLLAQEIEGTVFEEQTDVPIENVNVYFEKYKSGAVSNENGVFHIEIQSKINQKDTIQFSCIGYHSINLTFFELKKNNFVVYLAKKVENLNEVKITAKKKLKQKIQYEKLPSLKKGIHSFGSILIEDEIMLVGGDASYIEDTGKRTLLELEDRQDASFGLFISRGKLNRSWENYLGALQIFDLKNNTWTTSEVKFRERAYHNLVYDKNKLYVLGGKSLSKGRKVEYIEDKIEIFDVENQTIEIDNTNPHQAVNAASFCIENKVIVMGGSIKLKSNGEKIFTNKSHMLDLETGFWFELKDMSSAKEANGVVIEDVIYLIGGFNGKALKEIETYNLITGEWKKEGELIQAIESPALTFHDNTIFIFDDNKIYTYEILTKTLNEYVIDLRLKASELYYYEDKLYLLGGYTYNEYSQTPSPNFYSIEVNEFLNTEIKSTKKM